VHRDVREELPEHMGGVVEPLECDVALGEEYPLCVPLKSFEAFI
jgi:hypothetical protein